MLISILYFIASFIFFVLFIFFLADYHKTHNKFIYYYALAFLSMFLFSFTASVPVIVASDNLQLLAYSRIGQIIFIFGLLFACLRVQLIVTNHFFKKYFLFFNIAVGAIALYVISIAVLNLKTPEVRAVEVIWNTYHLAGKTLGLLAICYGVFWAYLFYKVASLISDKLLSRKLMSFSINGLLYGVAAFLLFTNENLEAQLLAILLFGIGGTLSAFVFLPPFIRETLAKRKKTL